MVHYYGDYVRRLFLVGAFLMALTLPFFYVLIMVGPVYLSMFAIVALGVAAGATNPRHRWVAVLDVCISVAAIITFEYHAIYASSPFGAVSTVRNFFWTNQTLTVIFLTALYYSVKTLRGKLMLNKNKFAFREEDEE